HADASPPEVAEALREVFSESDPRLTALLVAAMHRLASYPGEQLQEYFARMAERLAIELVMEDFRAGRVRAVGIRAAVEKLADVLASSNDSVSSSNSGSRPAGWASSEARAEALMEKFWTEAMAHPEFPAAEETLRGREAWCVPMSALRPYLASLAGDGDESTRTAPHSTAFSRARDLFLNYARGLESEDFSARQATASGLSEVGNLVELLWPKESPVELARPVERALLAESAPEIAGVLTAVSDRLAQISLGREDFAEYERMLDAVDKRARTSEQIHLSSLARRFLSEDRWVRLADAALAHRPLHPSLPRILGRDPERLLDLLTTRLMNNDGPNGTTAQADGKGVAPNRGAQNSADQLPGMARLLRAIGEPATGAMAARVFDPRTPRATAAVKLLVITQPARLLEVLPRALPGWDWSLQDMAVGELLRAGTSGCAKAFVEALPQAHSLVVPLLLDEIGIAKEASGLPALIEIASGKNERLRDVFVRIKAIEALGRMEARESSELLRAILRERNGLTHVEPAGLRAAAEESLAMMENHPSSVRVRKTNDAVAKSSVSHMRARRYLRVPLESPLTARIEDAHPVAARVTTISLGGAYLESGRRLNVGDTFDVAIRSGLSSIRGTAVVRNLEAGGGGVEFVHMKQDDREKLRKLITKLAKT
ncbi:MAG: PilZ domain-containing protein, partial [Acidobacteria bacterium]|nr:PilZ domain-containing protein [Acidobacteriota bacterium]